MQSGGDRTQTVQSEHFRPCLAVALIVLMIAAAPAGVRAAASDGLEASYRFLVSDRREQGGALFTATAGTLNGLQLPLSYRDSADYWGDYVCRLPGHDCAVLDVYDDAAYTLRPPRGAAGELQMERVNVHNGANIYDAATWQIAVMLGSAVLRLPGPAPQAAWALASGQNALLAASHDAEAHRISRRVRTARSARVRTVPLQRPGDHRFRGTPSPTACRGGAGWPTIRSSTRATRRGSAPRRCPRAIPTTARAR
jgi:hypothetical protein